LVGLGLPVAAFWAVISIVYASRKDYLATKKDYLATKKEPWCLLDGTGSHQCGLVQQKLFFILKHSRYNIIAALLRHSAPGLF
jgi:hypothetical protein